MVKNFSMMVLAIAVAIELSWLVGPYRYAGLFPVSIETTELWRNPWPAPGS